jgi:ABC-type multidrug transport system fused ATPase/permease subunit
MDAGSAAESDTPLTLMNRNESIFQSMCEKSGDKEFIYSVASNATR